MSGHKLNTRVSVQSNLGTIRYCGPFPAWPNVVALGVEWDDVSRGKHSGTYNGVEYFKTRIPNSGSFLKADRKYDRPIGFVDALKNRYAPDHVDEFEKNDITFGSKVALRVGFDKIRKLQAHLNRLTVVSLENQCVAYSSSDLGLICPAIEELDLSYNLFASLDEIAKIVVQLPRLKELRLNGNRFVSWNLSDANREAFNEVRRVSLAATLIPPEIIERLPILFPVVEECTLASNYLDFVELHFAFPWLRLTSLDLSYNTFSSIPEIYFDRSITLSILNLSHNHISIVHTHRLQPDHLTALDLRYNNISSWQDVDSLSVCFPELTDLKMQWNPVFEGMAEDETQLMLTARIGGLQILNGMKITDKGRLNAELYFMSKFGKGEIKEFDTTKPRWKQLCEIHSSPDEPQEQVVASKYLTITLVTNGETSVRKVPRNMTTQKLKMLVRKWYKLSQSNIGLAVLDSNMHETELSDPIKQIDYYGIDQGSKIMVHLN
ncbi:hypothetical protein V1512DRAFT_200365 [Lipomyces arxii]|uniref:uncharacterized protein n=1 Tax=Lipomyces arxii TaxID=56418 RepID=UPI0034D00234